MANKVNKRELHRIVSTAIIVKNGRYLIVQRSFKQKVFPGQWSVPGGGLEVEDYINTPKTTKDTWYLAIESSLRREIKEEVGLEVNKINYLLDMAFIRPDGIPVVVLSFWAKYKSGQVKLDKTESVDYKWATLKELKNYDLIGGIAEEIAMADKILRKGSSDGINFRYKKKL